MGMGMAASENVQHAEPIASKKPCWFGAPNGFACSHPH